MIACIVSCVTTYYYDKGWRSHRIFSGLFDQPFNHDNPQRDPFPSARDIATDANAMGVAIDPAVLRNLRAPTRKVCMPIRAVCFSERCACTGVRVQCGL
jgi:hypothetical protein